MFIVLQIPFTSQIHGGPAVWHTIFILAIYISVRMYSGGYYHNGLVVVTPPPRPRLQTLHRSHDNLKNPSRITSMMEECIHKCLRISCQCIIAVSMHANGQFLVCMSQQWHREHWHFRIVSVLFLGEGEVWSDYMCTGHAVWPACRLATATLCHTWTKEDIMLVIGQVRQSELLPTISFFPKTVRSTQIIFQTPFENKTHKCCIYIFVEYICWN